MTVCIGKAGIEHLGNKENERLNQGKQIRDKNERKMKIENNT